MILFLESMKASCFSVIFKQNLHNKFGKDLDAKIIDGIIASVCSVETGNHGNVNKSEIFVTNVLQFMLDMKLSELKIPTTSNTTVPVFGAGNCEVPAGTSNYNNAFGIQDKYMKVDEYDIARNLEVISPEGLPHASSSSKSFSLKYASPQCLITAIDGPYGSKKAPAIHPLRKVKARLHPEVTVGQHLPSVNTYPCGVKDFREFILPDGSKVVENDVRSVGGYVVGNNVAAPIARLNFLESTNNKGCSTFDLSDRPTVINRSTNFSGSRHDPIPVGDISPKTRPIQLSPEVEIAGQSSFSFCQAEMANKVDELYNKMSNIACKNGVDMQAEQLVDLTQNGFDKRKAKDDLISLQPMKTLDLPLLQNKRFPVSHSDISNFCAIVDLTYTRGV